MSKDNTSSRRSPSPLSTFRGFSRKSPLQVPTGKERRHRRTEEVELLQALSQAQVLGKRKPGLCCRVPCGLSFTHRNNSTLWPKLYFFSTIKQCSQKRAYKCLLPIQVRAITPRLSALHVHLRSDKIHRLFPAAGRDRRSP